MFLKEKETGHLVEVIDVEELFNPQLLSIEGRYQIGEADQDNDSFSKANLIFMSGESLPSCWIR